VKYPVRQLFKLSTSWPKSGIYLIRQDGYRLEPRHLPDLVRCPRSYLYSLIGSAWIPYLSSDSPRLHLTPIFTDSIRRLRSSLTDFIGSAWIPYLSSDSPRLHLTPRFTDSIKRLRSSPIVFIGSAWIPYLSSDSPQLQDTFRSKILPRLPNSPTLRHYVTRRVTLVTEQRPTKLGGRVRRAPQTRQQKIVWPTDRRSTFPPNHSPKPLSNKHHILPWSSIGQGRRHRHPPPQPAPCALTTRTDVLPLGDQVDGT